MEAWAVDFKNFLEDLKSQKGESGDNIIIQDMYPLGRQGFWWDKLEEAVEYVTSLNPKDVALRMRVGAPHPTGHAFIVVNAATQRFCFLKEEGGREAPHYLRSLITRIASGYNLQEVDSLKGLYDKPTKNLCVR